MAAISRIPFAKATFNGRLIRWIDDIHNRYGPVVRIAPNELTVVDPSAWGDIYLHRSDLHKDPVNQIQPLNGVHSLFSADDAAHSRQRKLLGRAFSAKALREQEPLIESHINLLIEKLRTSSAETAGMVDIVKWYNHTSLDMMWHLTFGESLSCLESDDYHPAVQSLLQGMKMAYLSACLRNFSPTDLIAKTLLSRFTRSKREANGKLIKNALFRRLEDENSTEQDFFSFIKPHIKGSGVTKEELVTNATGFIAGSESPAVTLCAATYYMLRNPEVFRKLKDEVRGAIQSASEISVSTSSGLPYLSAILQESLRMHHPAPFHLPRVVPRGGKLIAGHWIPEGVSSQAPCRMFRADLLKTVIGIPQLAAYVSPTNFEDPKSFVPERWLPDSDPRFASEKKNVFKPFSTGPRDCIGKRYGFSLAFRYPFFGMAMFPKISHLTPKLTELIT